MTSLGNITFAGEDPWPLAEFWAATLDYDLEEPPPEIIEAIEAVLTSRRTENPERD